MFLNTSDIVQAFLIILLMKIKKHSRNFFQKIYNSYTVIKLFHLEEFSTIIIFFNILFVVYTFLNIC